jgi:hypothetical protein
LAFLAVAIAGALFLLVPRPSGWAAQYVFAEDGPQWLGGFLRDGFASTSQTFAGYLHVAPRLIAGSCATVASGAAYPLCTSVSAALVRVAGMAIAFPVLGAYARSWRWGLAGASAFVFLPAGEQEVLGNITNLRWFLVAAAAFALIGVFERWALVTLATFMTLIGALSDPLTMLLLPLAAWRLWQSRSIGRLPATALVVGVCAQLLFLDPAQRMGPGLLWGFQDPILAIGQLGIRGILVAQMGTTLTREAVMRLGIHLSVLCVVLTLGLVVVVARTWGRNRTALGLALLLSFSGLAILYVTLAYPASESSLSGIAGPSQPARYSVGAGLLLVPAIVLAVQAAWEDGRRLGRVLAVGVASLLLVAVAVDFSGDPRLTDGPTWSASLSDARTLCGQPSDVVVITTTPTFEDWHTPVPCWWMEARARP